jgi:hypothetical protein
MKNQQPLTFSKHLTVFATILIILMLTSPFIVLSVYAQANQNKTSEILPASGQIIRNKTEIKPIFVIYPPLITTENATRNLISTTAFLQKYFDVVYLIDFTCWNGNITKLESAMDLYAKYNARVAITIVSGWNRLYSIPQLSPVEISYLSLKHNNLVGLRIAEYLTSHQQNDSILSIYESILKVAKENKLWVSDEEEFWTWGKNSGEINIDFSKISPIFQKYGEIVIPSTKLNGVSCEYWSWGTNIGFSLSFGTRWGVDVEAWYWYELRNRISNSEMEMPLNLMIDSALYALVHNATYLDFEPPTYFFNEDAMPNEAFLTYTQALVRYYENSAPKVEQSKIAILNLPLKLEPDISATGTDEILQTRIDFSTDLFSYYAGRTGNTASANVQKNFFNFSFEPEGLINTKSLIPVLPWGTPLEILKKFDFVMVDVPQRYTNAVNYSFLENPTEVYDYLLKASQYVDLFIPQALAFATNISIFADDSGTRINDFSMIDISSLTGLYPPYNMHSLFWGPSGPFKIEFNDTRYIETSTMLASSVVGVIPNSLDKSVETICSVNNSFPFIWHFVNQYNRSVYTFAEAANTKLRDNIREYIGRFINSILPQDSLQLVSDQGLGIYTQEYNPSKVDNPQIEPFQAEICKMNGNASAILYAPYESGSNTRNVFLSPTNCYAFAIDLSGFRGLIKSSSVSITNISYTDMKLNISADVTNNGVSIMNIWWPYGTPAAKIEGDGTFYWTWDNATKIIELNTLHSSSIKWTIENK